MGKINCYDVKKMFVNNTFVNCGTKFKSPLWHSKKTSTLDPENSLNISKFSYLIVCDPEQVIPLHGLPF
jgi:hypothetical protein